MQQMKRVDAFLGEVEAHLPGWLYSFNIADLKRRNGHLGHATGDSDIAEFSAALATLASDGAIVARVSAERWLLFSRKDACARVQDLLNAYRRSESTTTGWQIEASRGGLKKSDSLGIATTIARAVRCLYSPVWSPADLADTMRTIAKNNHDLPVDRPIALSDVPALARVRWSCVAEYPREQPVCPFCAGREFAWEGGDDEVYSGYGRCETCGADVAITAL